MEYGVVFPQTEIGADPGAIREYAQAAESLSYSHLLTYEHVLGADPKYHPGWSGIYSIKDMFHEPFVLLGYLAAITHRIKLVTGIVILPQRQTVLVAKQAAEVDVLSGGRLCLGIGLGWNQLEYEALGQDFGNRGRRCEEQVAVMRALWTQESVDFNGKWHRINGAGINPLPVQRPIPVWFGGTAEPVVKRIARIGDGWLSMMRPDARGEEAVAHLHQYTGEAGREPSSVALSASVSLGRGGMESALKEVTEWRRLGASIIFFNTMHAGLPSAKEHIDALLRFKEAVG